jgi:hypothetical protein
VPPGLPSCRRPSSSSNVRICHKLFFYLFLFILFLFFKYPKSIKVDFSLGRAKDEDDSREPIGLLVSEAGMDFFRHNSGGGGGGAPATPMPLNLRKREFTSRCHSSSVLPSPLHFGRAPRGVL